MVDTSFRSIRPVGHVITPTLKYFDQNRNYTKNNVKDICKKCEVEIQGVQSCHGAEKKENWHSAIGH